MRINKILIPAVLLAFTAVAISAFKIVKKASNISEKGFAVVELFTSEGCSSCPPADELVAKILNEDKNKAVYILAYHVDYWNHLGWKDEFSKAEYSERQRKYAGWLNLESVYTPQIVVNGKKEFVGSSEGTLRKAIQAGLQQSISSRLTLSDVHFTPNTLNLQYQAGSGSNQALVIAFVQKNAQTIVKSGENGGHTLSHVNIVRDLSTTNLRHTSGTGSIKLPAGFDNHTWEVIGFLQNTSTGEILAAQKVLTSGV